MKKTQRLWFALILMICFLFSSVPPTNAKNETVRFAIIGDYGIDNANSLAVANLVESWNVDFIVTTGDNRQRNYLSYERAVSKYYGDYLDEFYPCIGNHDDYPNGVYTEYVNYFDLPNNERYYDFVKGNIHFYSINSNPEEPHTRWPGGRQANWLRNTISDSTSSWDIVFFHHPPYTSGSKHDPAKWMQRWNLGEMGVDVVLSGHNHNYERIHREDVVFFVNGAGGDNLHGFDTPILGSQSRYVGFGAQLVTASESSINFKFIDINGVIRDDYTIGESENEADPIMYNLTLIQAEGVTYELPPGIYQYPEGSIVKIVIYIKMNRNYVLEPRMEPLI